jgi:hypothetical protein
MFLACFHTKRTSDLKEKQKTNTRDITVNKTRSVRERDIGQGPRLAVLFCVLCSVHFR